MVRNLQYLGQPISIPPWDEFEYDEKNDESVFSKELVNSDGEPDGSEVVCRLYSTPVAVTRENYFAYLKWFLKNAA